MKAWEIEGWNKGAKIRMAPWSDECFIYFDGYRWINWAGGISNNYQMEFHRDAWTPYPKPEHAQPSFPHRPTPKEIGCIVSAYTGVLCCPIDAFHEYIEKILGRSVWTHEFADQAVQKEIKTKSGPDFMRFVRWVHAEDKEESCPRS